MMHHVVDSNSRNFQSKGLRDHLSRVVPAVGVCLALAGQMSAQTLPQYKAIENQTPQNLVVFGADEVLSNFGVASGYQSDFDSQTTFYNSQVTYKNNTYYLWTQTGWEGAGCTSGTDGLDNVIISKSTNPSQVFRPSKSTGSISRSEMRRSMATDTMANDLCDDDYRWGIGDVIEFPNAGTYMVTFDLAKDGNVDHTKYSFWLAESDGDERVFSNTVTKFLDIAGLGRIMVEPIMYKINSTRAGFIYQHCASDGVNFTDCKWNYGFVDFSTFPNITRVRVRNSSGTLQDAQNGTWKVTFPMGSIPDPGGFLNTIVDINGKKVAFYSVGTGTLQDTKIGYRVMNTFLDGHFKGWSKTKYLVKDHNGLDLQFIGSSGFGLRYPAVVEDNSGTLHLFYTQNTTLQPGFRGLDIVHRQLAIQ